MMTLKKQVVLGLTVMATSSMLTPQPLHAHHSFSMYDRNTQYVFTGVVESINPDASHLQIIFVPLNNERNALVRDDSGERFTWSVEMESAGASAREGISVSTFPRGTVFSVALVPLRNGEPGGARLGAIFKCPEGQTPEPGKHCDSVMNSMHFGEEEFASATEPWAP